MNKSEKNSSDAHFMGLALALAAKGLGYVEPNPMVGCVIVKDGVVIGQGFHRKYGGPHAEVEALASAADQQPIRGATAYVTLEPCCHHGKTPPCTDALIAAGVSRVVIAMADPFEKVDGGGLAKLREAGIEITVGVLEEEARSLNRPYLKFVQTGKPWVVAKWAMTIDGRIATRSGQSQWITGEAARAEVHRLRGRVDAIAIGMGTVLADDPMLTARNPNSEESFPRQATRVVFCRNRLPKPSTKLVRSANEIPLLLVVAQPGGIVYDPKQLSALEAAGAMILFADPATMVDVTLRQMASQSATNLMVEGGAGLLGSFFGADEIDECHVYIAGKVFGSQEAPGPVGGRGVSELAGAWSFGPPQMDAFGPDVRLIYRR